MCLKLHMDGKMPFFFTNPYMRIDKTSLSAANRSAFGDDELEFWNLGKVRLEDAWVLFSKNVDILQNNWFSGLAHGWLQYCVSS